MDEAERLEQALTAARVRRLAVCDAPELWSLAHREVLKIEEQLAALEEPDGPAWISLVLGGQLRWGDGSGPEL